MINVYQFVFPLSTDNNSYLKKITKSVQRLVRSFVTEKNKLTTLYKKITKSVQRLEKSFVTEKK